MLMNGISMILWAGVDWCRSIAHDTDQKWRLECPYCDTVHTSRSYNTVLLKNSLHHGRAEDDRHPSADEMGQEQWEDNPAVVPDLVSGTTHIPDDEYP